MAAMFEGIRGVTRAPSAVATAAVMLLVAGCAEEPRAGGVDAAVEADVDEGRDAERDVVDADPDAPRFAGCADEELDFAGEVLRVTGDTFHAQDDLALGCGEDGPDVVYA